MAGLLMPQELQLNVKVHTFIRNHDNFSFDLIPFFSFVASSILFLDIFQMSCFPLFVLCFLHLFQFHLFFFYFIDVFSPPFYNFTIYNAHVSKDVCYYFVFQCKSNQCFNKVKLCHCCTENFFCERQRSEAKNCICR